MYWQLSWTPCRLVLKGIVTIPGFMTCAGYSLVHDESKVKTGPLSAERNDATAMESVLDATLSYRDAGWHLRAEWLVLAVRNF